jgi:hypothetical protein
LYHRNSGDGKESDIAELSGNDPQQLPFNAPPFVEQLKFIFFKNGSRIFTTILLFGLVPAGFVLNYRHERTISVFFVNFFAIIPSAALQSLAVSEISDLLSYQFKGTRMGDIFEGLISASFGYV